MDNTAGVSHKQQCECFACLFVKEQLIQTLINLKQIKNIESFSKVYSVDVIHINPYRITSNLLLDVSVYSKSTHRKPIKLVVKIPKEGEPSLFKKEILFYQAFHKYFSAEFMPKCYTANNSSEVLSHPAYIVLENLIARDFVQYNHEISFNVMEEYIKGLARFHANTMRIRNECDAPDTSMIDYFTLDDDQERIKQRQAISDFLDSPLVKDELGHLGNKIKEKVDRMTDLKESTISVLNHGSCTRFHIFYNKNETEFRVKFISFGALKLGSPAIDFGRILFTNLPNHKCPNYLKTTFVDLLLIYAKTITELRPEAELEQLLQDIINNLIFSYINLSTEEKNKIRYPKIVLQMLHNLGSLD